jgi:pimeloyl-ACP methyl ester carboxylesterase
MLERTLSIAVAFGCVLAAQSATRAGTTTSGIAYEVRGKGPVVALLTGSNLDRRMWAHEAEWLASDHTVVLYDLRAHGQSDTARAPFSHVGDLFDVLDELKIAKATLIGLSAGSAIALDAALRAPDRVDQLVLVGPAPSGYVARERPAFAGDLMAALQARDYKKAAEVLLATPVFAAPPASQALVRQMVTENDRLWTVSRDLMKAERPSVDHLNDVKQPTLVLVGENDVAQKEPASVLGRGIPGARLVVIPGGGHLLNLTSPAEFEREVRAFLR